LARSLEDRVEQKPVAGLPAAVDAGLVDVGSPSDAVEAEGGVAGFGDLVECCPAP